jgi:hypothetical protein
MFNRVRHRRRRRRVIDCFIVSTLLAGVQSRVEQLILSALLGSDVSFHA